MSVIQIRLIFLGSVIPPCDTPLTQSCIGGHCSRQLCSRPDVCSRVQKMEILFYHPRTQYNWRHMRTILFDLEIIINIFIHNS